MGLRLKRSLLTGRLEKEEFLSDGDDQLNRGDLFNLKDDSYETNDVYEEFPEVVKVLKQRFLQSGAVSLQLSLYFIQPLSQPYEIEPLSYKKAFVTLIVMMLTKTFVQA